MASYTLNQAGYDKAKALIDTRQYVLRSTWTDAQPTADAENAYLEDHSWQEYGEWHLALTDGAGEETKARLRNCDQAKKHDVWGPGRFRIPRRRHAQGLWPSLFVAFIPHRVADI